MPPNRVFKLLPFSLRTRFLGLTLLHFCAGCRPAEQEFERRFGVDAPRPVMIAVRTEETVKIDGILSEKAWRNAPAYPIRRAFRNFDIYAPKTAAAASETSFFMVLLPLRR